MRRALPLVALVVGLSLAAPVHAQDPTPQADTWIEGDWTIEARRLDAFDISATIAIHEAVVDGEALTADDIRDRYRRAQARGQGDAFKDEIETAVRDEVRAALDRFFVRVDERSVGRVELRNGSLTAPEGGSPYHPTVDVDVRAYVDTRLPGDAPENVTRQRAVDALRMGAVTPIEIDVAADAGANHTVTLHLPPDVRAVGDVPTPVEIAVHNWNGSTTERGLVPVGVTGADATRFRQPDGTVNVRVDLHEVAIDPLAGRGTVQAGIDVDARVRAVLVPEGMRNQVPPDVRLQAVGADGIRLALQRGYLPESWTRDARARFADRAGQALRSAFGTDVPVQVTLDDDTLRGGIRGDPDADPPLIVRATARTEQTFSLLGSSHQAAIVLSSVDRQIPLHPFPPFGARYEIVVPDGATLESARLQGGGSLQRATVDGRDAIVVTVGPRDEDTTATMSLGVTPGLLVGASPWIAVGVLVALAAVVLVVVKVVVGRDGDGEGE